MVNISLHNTQVPCFSHLYACTTIEQSAVDRGGGCWKVKTHCWLSHCVLRNQARHFIHCSVLVQPKKTGNCPDKSEKLLAGSLGCKASKHTKISSKGGGGILFLVQPQSALCFLDCKISHELVAGLESILRGYNIRAC